MNTPPIELSRTIGTRLPLIPDRPWLDQANCQGEDPHLFFPTLGENSATISRIVATYCHPCPVKQECFDSAVASDERDGIWGGVHFGGRVRGAYQLIECEQCGSLAKDLRQGIRRKYCSVSCRKKANRAQKRAS